MLLSLLISLTPTARSPILGPLGRPVQAWVLAQITRFRPKLAAALHDLQGYKPYTVSTLLDERGRPGCRALASAWGEFVDPPDLVQP